MIYEYVLYNLILTLEAIALLQNLTLGTSHWRLGHLAKYNVFGPKNSFGI